MDNKVLAVVAGEEITEQDLNDFMENVPQDQQAYRSNPQFRQQYLEQLTALRMFSKQGEELKPDEVEVGAKEVIQLDAGLIEERFGVAAGEGVAWM